MSRVYTINGSFLDLRTRKCEIDVVNGGWMLGVFGCFWMFLASPETRGVGACIPGVARNGHHAKEKPAALSPRTTS